MTGRPVVLYACIHNGGRSLAAKVLTEHHAAGGVEARSAGSEPAERINPIAVQAMREAGIDITGEQPKVLTTDAVEHADVVVTMGCGDTCPIFPGKRYEDWNLTDPAGQPIDVVRQVRDEIRDRVQHLVNELLPQGISGQ